MSEGMPGTFRDRCGPGRFVDERQVEGEPDGMNGMVVWRGRMHREGRAGANTADAPNAMRTEL